MTSARTKRARKRFKRIVGTLILAVMIAIMLPRIASIARLYEQKQSLLEQKQQLEQEKAELTETRDSMDNLETIEKIAREKLGMIKEGERLMMEKKE